MGEGLRIIYRDFICYVYFMVCWIYCLINFLIFYFEMFWENFNKFKINYLLKYEIDKYIIFCFVLYIYELKIWIKLKVLL